MTRNNKKLHDALIAREVEIVADAVDAGGATWDNELNPITHKTGYMVALPRYEVKLSKYDIVGIVEAVNRSREIIITDGRPTDSYFIDLWIDGDDAYVEISLRETRRNVAVAIGKSFDHEAIYDLKNEKNIWV